MTNRLATSQIICHITYKCRWCRNAQFPIAFRLYWVHIYRLFIYIFDQVFFRFWLVLFFFCSFLFLSGDYTLLTEYVFLFSVFLSQFILKSYELHIGLSELLNRMQYTRTYFTIFHASFMHPLCTHSGHKLSFVEWIFRS